jgi:5,5'-dehydrodivanillate O-demethylase oxygenase subunit
MTEISERDLLLAGPGTLAGRYLRRFWQPLYLSRDLAKGHAKPVRAMGERFTLYRGASGTTHLMGPRCCHRGAQLSAGWVEDDCIRCLYHGWKFDGSGRCVEQPAEPDGFKDKVRIASYPTEEYLGLVFAYLGEGSPPPLPRYPWFESEGVLEADTYVRYSNYFYTLDNHADEVHVIFTHRNTAFSRAGLELVPVIEAEEASYGLHVVARYPNGKSRANQLLMPNIIMFKSSPAKGDEGFSDRAAWRVPLDDDSHLSFGIDLRHLRGAAAERYREAQAEERTRTRALCREPADQVARQILDGQRSLEDPDILARPDLVNIQDCVAQMGQPKIAEGPFENLGRSDRGVVLFRRLWLRELRALAEGRSLKQWRAPELLETQAGRVTALARRWRERKIAEARMNRITLTLTLVLASLAAADAHAQAPAPKFGPEVTALVEQAAKEGKLQLSWSGGGFGDNGKDIPKWIAGFNKFYGLNLPYTFTPAPSMPQQAAAVLQAAQSNTPAPTDVFIVGPDNLVTSIKAHSTHPYEWVSLAKQIGVDLPPTAAATDDAGVAFATEVFGITYNSQAVAAKDMPQTLEDVLKPEWKGRIATTPYAAGFNALAAFDPHWGPAKTTDFVTNLSKQVAGLIRCSEPGPLLSGQFDMLVLECDIASAIVEHRHGQPIGYVIPKDAIITDLWYMAVPKTAPDAAAGALLALFMLTQEGQALSWEADGGDLSLLLGSHTAKELPSAEADIGTAALYVAHPEMLDYSEQYIKIITAGRRR